MTYSHHDAARGKAIIISIAGDLGSGKSLLTGTLVGHFGAERYSTGNAQRKIAADMGITTLELNQLAEKDKSIDDKIDGVFKDLAHTPVPLVVDSRMAFHFLPMSFKIRLEVHPRIAAERIQGDTGRIGEASHTSVDDIEAGIMARKASERARFKAYYDVDIEDHAGYDLVINTTDVSPEAVSALAVAAIEAWAEGKAHAHGFYISPRQLFVRSDLVGEVVLQNGKSHAKAVKAVRGAVCTSVTLPDAPMGQEAASVMTTGLCPLIVQDGADIVRRYLQSGQELVRVDIADGEGQVPDSLSRDMWQDANNFKYLDVWGLK